MVTTTYYSSHCPHTNSNQSIEIDYSVVPILGISSKEYKKTNWSCPLSDECRYLIDGKYCPLFLNAPDKPNL